MSILLGVDTGGTYTDAALIDGDKVLASAKSLTTRHDLAVGIGGAVEAVLAAAAINPGDVGLCSLSTTLATNALVEGQGARVALVFIGFSEGDVARQGLQDALGSDPVVVLSGGHTHSGGEAAAFDGDALRAALERLGPVSGFAVAAQFATRNPAHEVAARDIIRVETGAPVTCSHELSAKLGGPKRAMTAVLNARLIGMIDSLIGAAERYFRALGIRAPMMVTRGDGALISSAVAREKPIETILSGPAASLVGARWLTGADRAIVSDIGGTTTDVAVLADGRPTIDPDGAQVGGFRTMVEAVAMRTTGLGGDSEVHVLESGLAGGLTLGPRRVVPLSLAALQHGEVVLSALERQEGAERLGDHDGRFVLPARHAGHAAHGLPDRDARLLERVGDTAWEMGKLLKNRMELAALDRLRARGLLMVAALTPSDAAHELALLDAWNGVAARKGLALLARRRNGAGELLAPDPRTMAQRIIDQLTRQTAQALMECAFAEDRMDPALARHPLTLAGHARHRGLTRLDAGLALPVIGLGASAGSYYRAVGQMLGTEMVLPAHAGVANAIGAVVGQITMRRTGQITAAGQNRYRVHLPDGPADHRDRDAAFAALRAHLDTAAEGAARDAGAEGIRLSAEEDLREATVDGKTTFVEATITVTATGRPRITA